MNCENSLKVVTGSRIVSPLAMVRKSNIPALSRKVLSIHGHGLIIGPLMDINGPEWTLIDMNGH